MDTNGQTPDRIASLKKRLYSRTVRNTTAGRRRLPGVSASAKNTWNGGGLQKPPSSGGSAGGGRARKWLRIFVIASFAFFIAAVAFSAFYFLRGSNLISTDKVDITISGPTAVAGGEEATFDIEIRNRNSIPLELADLIVEFPPGTRAAEDITREQTRYREGLGTIPPGETVERTVKAVLFGAENTPLDVRASVEWRAGDSNAIFFTEKIYELTLSSAPVGIAVRNDQEVTVGQEQSFVVTVVSNSETPLENIGLAAEFPFGFTYSSSEPERSAPGFWRLGTLEPGEERVVTIRGKMAGQESDERTFRFSVGVVSERNDSALGAAYSESVVPVIVKSPFLGATLALNGSTDSNPIGTGGDPIRADITWENNAGGRITDASIRVRINGAALDPSSVSVSRGFYQSSDGTIVWDRRTNPELADIAEGARGSVSFSFVPRQGSALASLRNPEIQLEVDAAGTRVDESGVPERVEAHTTRTIRIASDITLEAAGLYSEGPFSNTGPHPPRAEQETTYTLRLAVENPNNSLSNARVTGVLPSYVRWLGITNPSGASISYNPVGGVVTWNLGDVAAGVGVDRAPIVAHIQVAVTPSLSQVGTTPSLITDLTVTGTDRFTKGAVQDSAPAITTGLDGSFGSGVVGQ